MSPGSPKLGAMLTTSIVIEVRLFDCAILDRDALHQGEAQPVDNAALGLRRHIVRLHRDTAIERAPEIVQHDVAGGAFERHLGGAGDERIGIVEERKSHSAAVALLAPLRHPGNGLDTLRARGSLMSSSR